jgi:predicted RNA-binding Zn ribbon-like protein
MHERICEFVNTAEFELGRDDLDDWLRRRGVEPTADDLRGAAEVREALRALLLAHNGVAVDLDAASAVLDDAARRARLAVRFAGGSPEVVAGAAGVDGVLGGVLADVAAAAAGGTWARLKACRAESCRWAFYDSARNRSRIWCSMEVCGNRAKARRFRARQ